MTGRLKKLHNDFLKYFAVEKGRTQRTIQSYKYNFGYFLEWLKRQGLPLALLSVGDYQVLRRYMYYMSDRKLHRQTVRQRMLALKSFCKYLVREDILQRNPFDRFDIPKKEKRLPRPLDNRDSNRLLTFVKRRYEKSKMTRDLQAVVIVELASEAGFRKGAVRNLKWENIDFKNGLARVIDKGQKEKCYVLPSPVLHYLKLLKLARGIDKGTVCLSPRSNNPISITSLHNEFKRYVRLSGLGGRAISLHRLRHTFGTALYEGTGDIMAVQEAMGHEDIGSTLGYVQVSKKSLKEKLERVFSNAK